MAQRRKETSNNPLNIVLLCAALQRLLAAWQFCITLIWKHIYLYLNVFTFEMIEQRQLLWFCLKVLHQSESQHRVDARPQ